MTRMTAWRVTAVLAGLMLVPAAGCKKKQEQDAEVPGGGQTADLPPEQQTGPPTLPGQAPKMDEKPRPTGPKPHSRDRDPEEEKRKMSLSKDRSAEAFRLLRQGQFDQAILHCREALKIHELNADAMIVMAEAYLKQGKHELTLTVADSALQVDPRVLTPEQSSRAFNLKGFAYLGMDKEKSATNSFRKAAETDDKNAAAWNNLGTRYLLSGDTKTAVGCFRYAVELDPGFVKARLNYGASLRASRKWLDAERELNKALELNADYAEAFFNLGVLYLDAEDYPGLALTERLNKAIVNLTKYRELAIAQGAKVPKKAGARGRNKGPAPPPKLGVKPTVEAADDYITVAKKGIEREKSRKERDAKRKARDAEKKKRDAEKKAKKAAGGDADKDAAKKGGGESPKPQKPKGKSP